MRKHRNPRARLPKPPTPDNRRAELPPPTFDIPAALGLLQELVGRVDALVYATERHFERFGWRYTTEVDETENPLGHLAHLIGAAREASLSAVSLGAVIAAELDGGTK